MPTPKFIYRDNFPELAKAARQALEDKYIEDRTRRGETGGGRGYKNPPTIAEINSREQYEHEKEVGDPNALRLSFEEWKQL